MRDIVVLVGREYHSHQFVGRRLGVDRKTVWAWVEIGTLPKPIRMRRHSYFDLAVVERRILASAHL